MKFKVGDLVMLIATDNVAPFRVGMIGPILYAGRCVCKPPCDHNFPRYIVDFPNNRACCAERALMKISGGGAIVAAERATGRTT
jgi:hypothetical protein